MITSLVAASLSLVLHGFSLHATDYDDNGRKWDETNYGMGLRYEVNKDWAMQGGFYQNSQHRTSVYAGVDWLPLHVGPFSAGGGLGIATGYSLAPVVPVATLNVRATLASRVDVMVRYLPPITPKMTSVAAVEFSLRF